MNTNFKIAISSILFFIILVLSYKSYTSILSEESLLDEKNPNIIELSPYKNIQISTMSANINIVKGDKFTLEYKLHPREEESKIEIIDDTFIFNTDFKKVYDNTWDSDLYTWYIILTIPKKSELELVDIVTVDGDVVIKDWKMSDITIKNTSGEIWLENIEANSLAAQTISGDIDIKNCTIGILSANTVADSMRVTGKFSIAHLNSISDMIHFSGTVKNTLDIKTVSGDIHAEFQDQANIKATSFKKIVYNDVKNTFTFEKLSSPSLFDKNIANIELNSTSGRIKIDTLEYLKTKKN